MGYRKCATNALHPILGSYGTRFLLPTVLIAACLRLTAIHGTQIWFFVMDLANDGMSPNIDESCAYLSEDIQPTFFWHLS